MPFQGQAGKRIQQCAPWLLGAGAFVLVLSWLSQERTVGSFAGAAGFIPSVAALILIVGELPNTRRTLQKPLPAGALVLALLALGVAVPLKAIIGTDEGVATEIALLALMSSSATLLAAVTDVYRAMPRSADDHSDELAGGHHEAEEKESPEPPLS